MDIGNIPRVTVLTPVKNGERYLDRAVASIIDQSYRDFEYIIINDGSTDGTPAILDQWAARDARIHVLHNARSLNASGAIHRGLAVARGEYVAVLDSDDLAYPTRLAEQVAYLDAHPKVALVGSQVQVIDEQDKKLKISEFPVLPCLAHWQLFFVTPVLHSAAMMRRELVARVGNYSTRAWAAGDYELFTRLAQVGEIANLPTTLVAYRRWSSQMTSTHRRIQNGQVLLFLQALLMKRYGFDPRTLPALSALYYGVRGYVIGNDADVEAAGELLTKVYAKFKATVALSAEDAEVVAQDCARRLLALAWAHRRGLRATSRAILARALAIDPNLWQRPRTWLGVRTLYRKEVNRARAAALDPALE